MDMVETPCHASVSMPTMKAYLITTGILFALIGFAHLARMIAEPGHRLHEPIFHVLTLLAFGLSAWAWRLLARSGGSARPGTDPGR